MSGEEGEVDVYCARNGGSYGERESVVACVVGSVFVCGVNVWMALMHIP